MLSDTASRDFNVSFSAIKDDKAYPFASGYAFVRKWIFVGMFMGIAWKERTGFIPPRRSSAHPQPFSAPCFYPAAHKFIKLFEIRGAGGQKCPTYEKRT